MSLNKQSGNMYGFVTHTWNTVKGKCPHDCSYCYMKRFPQSELHFDENELKTNLGRGNTIFVGSSCDMWADDIPADWIEKTLQHCINSESNAYLFQTKNPSLFNEYLKEYDFPQWTVLCITLETNRKVKNNSPNPASRGIEFSLVKHDKKMVTIEPIMDFDLHLFVDLISLIKPFQVNIGADTGNNHLPEPEDKKIIDLIIELSKFTEVHTKDNLKRLLK